MIAVKALLLAVLAGAAFAGAAQADPLAISGAAAPRLRAAGLAAVQSQPAALPLMSRSPFTAPRTDGVVQTSVEKSFGNDGAVGQAGFLCGLMPHPDTSGAAAAFGNDPDGRFVGARMSLTF